MISTPSPFQPYRVLTDEPTTLRCIISEQILMQPRLVVKILPRQPVAHHWPAPGASSCSRCRHTQTRADTVPDFTHCEFYSWVEGRSVRLCGEWMPQARFINGMPVKIRVMKDCIVITLQNTREL